MKRFLSFLLVVFLSLGVLVACSGDDVDNNASLGGVTSTDTYHDDEGNYVPRHKVEDMGGRTFTIIVIGPAAETYRSDDFTTDSKMYGELMNVAVQKRNDKVEALYNVDLEVIQSDQIYVDVYNDCAANTHLYDAVMPTLNALSVLASQEQLYELTALENFDINAPWYDKNCTEAFSINNKVYFTTGDITILNKVCTPSILFNKEMMEKNFPETNLYELVGKKEWTFDKMVELADEVADTSANDPNRNVYGMMTCYNDTLSFYGASGELICGKDKDDLPYLALGASQRSVGIATKVLDTYANADWLAHAETFPQPIWETSFAVFYTGRALFRPSAFSATTKLRSLTQIEFGILPMPLMDDTQTEYYSYCGTGATAGIAIPQGAADPEFSAYMIEAYSAWAKNYITKEYYEVNLKTKDARDDESEAMLDLIFSNIVYDIGECFNFGNLKDIFGELTKQKSTAFVSSVAEKSDVAKSKIDELVKLYVKKQ